MISKERTSTESFTTTRQPLLILTAINFKVICLFVLFIIIKLLVYKIKDENLKQLFWQIRDLILSLGGRIIFEHISREQNKQADKLVNLAVQKRGDV